MGQAKIRGTKEERIAQGIIKRQKLEKEHKEAMLEFDKLRRRSGKSKHNILAALAAMFPTIY